MWTWIKGIISFIILIILFLVVIKVSMMAISGFGYITEHGLKNFIEEIWQGKKK